MRDAAATRPEITVLTATYQRAELLPRLYESLRAQTFRGFEWIVIDDGSTDGTRELLERLARDAGFPLRVLVQENSGKHVAINRGVREARGRFCAIIDSDDWYKPHALERMLFRWNEIPAGRRGSFANVEGLRVLPDETLAGDRFPAETYDSTTFDLGFVEGIGGDTIGMYRTDVLREHPYPEDAGRYVPDAFAWNRISQRYSSRFVNEVWAYVDYQPDGMSNRSRRAWIDAAPGLLAYFRDIASFDRPMPLRLRARSSANVVRYALHAGASPLRELRGTRPAWIRAAALPLGAALWLRDRMELRREREAGSVQSPG
ncbi:MAG: glycosyltransferase family 2 protein [Thermoleophilaceae bacterium]|nr:glycosyltransferase family 2 protein [Thermoleophilaceae bacterium]